MKESAEIGRKAGGVSRFESDEKFVVFTQRDSLENPVFVPPPPGFDDSSAQIARRRRREVEEIIRSSLAEFPVRARRRRKAMRRG